MISFYRIERKYLLFMKIDFYVVLVDLLGREFVLILKKFMD